MRGDSEHTPLNCLAERRQLNTSIFRRRANYMTKQLLPAVVRGKSDVVDASLLVIMPLGIV